MLCYTQHRRMVESRNKNSKPPRDSNGTADAIVDLVRGLLLDLHPHRKSSVVVRLESTLDRDLGIDSLGRAELLVRVEHAFQVRLGKEVVSQVETLGDVLVALEDAGGGELPAPERPPALKTDPVEGTPADARTLMQALDWHVEFHAERTHILQWDEPADRSEISYGRLRDGAADVSRGLNEWGLRPGEQAAIMLPTGADFFRAFFGVLYAGGVPVPIYPPLRLAQLEDHLRRQAAVLNNAEAVILITSTETGTAARLVQPLVTGLRGVKTVEQLASAGKGLRFKQQQPPQTALIQYTSGSTGDPKGVVLSHANLLANLRAMAERLQADSTDIFVSWLPLYHDMGLIGAWLGALYFGFPLVIMSPLTFLTRPQEWLWAIHRHRGTLSAAPNFAFELASRKIEDRDIEGLDLGSLRMLLNGAEPVPPSTLRKFTDRFQKHGLRRDAPVAVYGMAENSVGLAIPLPGQSSVIDRVQRGPLTGRGQAAPAPPGDPNAIEFVGCGRPLRGHEVRIVDGTGREAGERKQGRLQFRGPSATSGYFRNPAKTNELFDGEWLESGDLAYVAKGNIFITGRSKDIIIRAGRNIYPHEVEQAAGEVEGIRKGCVAVFGSTDPKAGTERIVVVAESRENNREAVVRIRQAVEQVTTDLLEAPPDEVVIAPPHTVLKTSSGKIRRAATREIYESGALIAGRRAVWWQFVRLMISGGRRRAADAAQTTLVLLYGIYWWLVVALAAICGWTAVVLLPGPRSRWAVGRRVVQLALRLMGTSPSVKGLENLRAPGGIVVANHASFVDGLVLVAALPGEMAFVVKGELRQNWFAERFLSRVGSLFVERIDPARGLEDSRRAVALAKAEQRLVFFPEGTFTRMPGLLEFRLGAFVVAAESGRRVIPVTIRGTRTILRDEQWLPRKGSIQIEVGEPLLAEGNDFQAAVRLRDAARAGILERSGENDLADERLFITEAGAERVDLRDR